MINVKLLRLKSGEDIIADVTLVDTEDTIKIENPAILMPMGDKGGQKDKDKNKNKMLKKREDKATKIREKNQTPKGKKK